MGLLMCARGRASELLRWRRRRWRVATIRRIVDLRAAKGKIDPAEVPAIHARVRRTLALGDLAEMRMVMRRRPRSLR